MLQLVAKLTLDMYFLVNFRMVSIHEKDDFSVNDTGGSEKKKRVLQIHVGVKPITFGRVLIKF